MATAVRLLAQWRQLFLAMSVRQLTVAELAEMRDAIVALDEETDDFLHHRRPEAKS
jgi:hypothetical protein